MDLLNRYVNEKYEGRLDWFIEEVNSVDNQQRVSRVIDLKQYLSGHHKILHKPSYKFNGRDYIPKKIVLQLAKTMMNFGVSYLLSHPITLTGEKSVTDAYKQVYKRGKYNRVDFDILDKVSKYGYCAEYVYLNPNKDIVSKLFSPEDSFPIYDDRNNYIAFVESYCMDGVDYFTVYLPNEVNEYNNQGGDLRLIYNYPNLSGLPIIYHNQSEIDNLGRSDLLDIIPVLDEIENIISKTGDAYDHYLTGIPVVSGQILKGEGIPREVIGSGLVLDDGAELKFVSNPFDVKGFESLYKHLTSALLDIANVPAISMSKTDISNLSEVSIRLLFSLADMRASLNERFIREGIDKRFDIIRRLLKYKGINITNDDYDSLGYVFHYARPSNDKEVVENLEKLKQIKAISLETLLERNPYITDVQGEMNKIKEDITNSETVTV